MHADFCWQSRSGRYKGEKFDHLLLVHGTGRIFAKIFCPVEADEYEYDVALCGFGRPFPYSYEAAPKFIDQASAQRFVEMVVDQVVDQYFRGGKRSRAACKTAKGVIQGCNTDA